MQWCRLYAEITRDPKTARLPDGAFRLFVELMALAAEAEADGDTKLSREDIDWTLRRPACEFLDELTRRDLAGVSPGGTVVLTNWGKRQSRSDDSAPRVRALRERERNCHVTASNESGNGPEESREEQSRTEKKGADAPAPWIPADVWADFAAHRKGKRAPMTPRAVKLIVRDLAEFRERGIEPATVLEYAIKNGHTGLFYKSEQTSGSKTNRGNPSLAEQAAQSERDAAGWGSDAG